jgi:hypothetical protein
VKLKAKIEMINAELEDQRKSLGKLDGYEDVLKVVKIYLRVLPFYERMYNAIVEIKKNLQIS